ncbi:AMP-binding protein [Kitasatospora sp. NPDC088391]|uniref:class I adenylate-forming enzyme family protein n=1 Tax=Kitasatospora sp. NPDC088391 TaxID=3364074 RepID=UPI00380BA3EC
MSAPGAVISVQPAQSARAARPARAAAPAVTLPELLDHRAAAQPDRTALLVPGGGSLTYRQWRERAVRAAHGLAARGVRPGGTVALLFTGHDWDGYAVAFLAAHYAGAAALVVRADLTAGDARRLVADTGAGLAVTGADPAVPDTGLPAVALAELLAAPADSAASPPHTVTHADPAQIIGTSGTTGTPKGVLAAHGSLTAGLRTDPRPRPYAHSAYAVHAFPIGTNAAQVVLVNALVGQPATICLPRFDAAGLARAVEEFGVGTVFLVPSMAVELLNSGTLAAHDFGSVLLVSCSAAALPPAVAAALAAALPRATLVNTYTSAESSPAQLSVIVDPARPGSLGRPADPGALRVLAPDGRPAAPGDTGEIWLRQPGPPRSYAGDPDRSGATFRDGWVRMGDLGRLDADGCLHLVDREGDLVKSGALKVSTLRIEAVLHEHPQVADAAALGLPHPVMGAVPVAAVVPHPAGLDPDALRLFLAERLARPELPVRILLVDSLPRNPSGKVVKHLLRNRFDEPSDASAPSRPPGGPTETALAALWRTVLGRPVTGVEQEFFALGGDSFRAVQLAAAISAEFGVPAGTALVFERPALRAQADWLDRHRAAPPAPTGPGPAAPAVSPFLAALRAQPHELPLTSQQENFLRWLAEAPGRRTGSVAVAFRVTEALRTDLLGRALTETVRRHPALRTRFVPVPAAACGGQTGVRRAVLDEDPRVDLAVHHLPGATDAEVDTLLAAERDRPADLAADPAVRLAVVTRAPDDHVVLLGVDHLVCDGWSVGLLLRELAVHYSAFRRDRPAPAPRGGPGPQELADRARAHWAANRAHFAAALAGAPAAVDPFPGRAPAGTVRGAVHPFTVAAAPADALRARAAELGATPSLAVAALWTGLLAARSGQDDLVLMTPVPGRTRPEDEHAVGCFVQSLLVRVDASGTPGFAELLDRLRAATSAALDHQLYPFAEFSPQVPFPAWLRHEAWSAPAHLPGLACAPWELPPRATDPYPVPGGDLHVPELAVTEQPDGSLRCRLRYNAHAFDPATAAGLADAFTAALHAAVRFTPPPPPAA